MRRAAVVLLVLVAFSMCKRAGLTIYAPDELVQATISIDGREAGHFEKTQRLYRWVGWLKMKQELSAPPRSETIAVLPEVAPGRHDIKIEKAGYEPVVATFSYSGRPSVLDLSNVQLTQTASR